MNYFIALPVRYDLSRICLQLAKSFAGQAELIKSWHHPDDWHITCCFAGELSSNQITELATVVTDCAVTLRPFRCRVTRVIGIGGKRPHYLALNLQSEQLLVLKNRLDEAVAMLGINLSKQTFIPHISIARLRKSNFDWQAHISSFDLMLDGLALYRSRPIGEEGARYEILSYTDFPLALS